MHVFRLALFHIKLTSNMAAWFMLQSFMSLHLIDTRHFDPFYGTIWMSQEQKRTGGI